MNASVPRPSEISGFIESLYRGKGFYSWSRDSDRYAPGTHWGLANTVFAVKTLAVLDLLNAQDAFKRREITDHILSFRTSGGAIRDPLVRRKARWKNMYVAIRQGAFSNFFGRQTAAAETRQAWVALGLLGCPPPAPFTRVPENRKRLEPYLRALRGKNVWMTASYLGHIVFFLQNNAREHAYREEESASLVAACLESLTALQDPGTGSWAAPDAPIRQKINGAMKIVSIYRMCPGRQLPRPDRLLDTLLGAHFLPAGSNACDHLNAMLVLKTAFDAASRAYRPDDVRNFCERVIESAARFVRGSGGFCFTRSMAARYYYGLRVTRPFSGPDIHGTYLWTWTIALASRILDENAPMNDDIPN